MLFLKTATVRFILLSITAYGLLYLAFQIVLGDHFTTSKMVASMLAATASGCLLRFSIRDPSLSGHPVVHPVWVRWMQLAITIGWFALLVRCGAGVTV